MMAGYRAQAGATDQAMRAVEDIGASGPVTANASALETAVAIKVTLRPSAYGGVNAVVVIPGRLVMTEDAAMSGGRGTQSGSGRPALYSGTAGASVPAQPRLGRPAPGWWTRQKLFGTHAAGGAREDDVRTDLEG